MAAIGSVETMYLQTTDQLGTKYETNISKGFKVNSEATYQQVDAASRALAELSTNTYGDTLLITKVSVNEKLDEEGE